jgi:hypothetical protein
VRDDQAGVAVTTVGDHACVADRALGPGSFHAVKSSRLPGTGWPTEAKASVGIDDDLVVSRITVVLGLLLPAAIPFRHQSAVHDQRSRLIRGDVVLVGAVAVGNPHPPAARDTDVSLGESSVGIQARPNYRVINIR